MSYRIVYGDEPKKLMCHGIRLGRIAAYTALCFALFAVLTMAFWPEGKALIQDVFLPGDAAVTAQALENMVDHLRAGEAIGDAVVVFCREIIAGANLAD